ncbi:MAG: hypothetical protein M1457_08710 [bacterium]|nr:hypothetical protein [bacterium]
MLPKTTMRVTAHTADHINRQIAAQTERNIAFYAVHPELIDQRLEELDREWDIERTLETNAAVVGLAGLVLGTRDRRWLFVPALVGGFLLQHALQGWSPPVPFMRRLGVRTQSEIEAERFALKALRGDFKDIPPDGDAATRTSFVMNATGAFQAPADGLQE